MKLTIATSDREEKHGSLFLLIERKTLLPTSTKDGHSSQQEPASDAENLVIQRSNADAEDALASCARAQATVKTLVLTKARYSARTKWPIN